LVVAASLLPVKAHAGYRGAFGYISAFDDLIRGKFSPTLRNLPSSGAGTAASPKVERWLAFVTLSSIVGSESVGEIWMYRFQEQAFLLGNVPTPLLRDPAGIVSYVDPAWSKDGKWLAYVQTNNSVNSASIYVQQFDQDPSDPAIAGAPLGSPILIADGTGGIHNRHPAFRPDGTQIAYDSDAFGASIDLWTVNVSLDGVAHTGTVDQLSRTRHQLGLESTPLLLDTKAEFKPAYDPSGTHIAYVTNRFGVFQIQILTPTANGSSETSVASQVNPGLVTHDNPSYAPDGNTLYYDAPSNEDPANPQDIWKLDLTTGAKCNMFIDLAGDVDPNVSQYTNLSSDGIPFNYFVFISQAGGFGVQIWRGESIQDCNGPLAMNVNISPSSVNLGANLGGSPIAANITFPAATKAAGYICRAANVGGEGVRMRVSVIPSPTLAGLHTEATPTTGDCTDMDMLALFGGRISCFDVAVNVFGNIGHWVVNLDPTGGTDHTIIAYWPKRTIIDKLVALGLVNAFIPLEVRAYSNRVGRQFLGFGYMKLNSGNNAGSIVAMQQNYPNPFNPVTKINFATSKPGNVDVRVFNTRGELVRTITNQWYPQGEHTVSWDGKTVSGGHAPSGIYYVRATSGGSTDVIKTVLAK
jgi:hypothetical protein